MKDFDRRFNRVNTFVNWFIGVVFFLAICWIGFLGLVVYKSASAVQSADWSQGIKPVIEKAWCGKPGCMDSK